MGMACPSDYQTPLCSLLAPRHVPYAPLRCITLHYITLQCITLHYITPSYIKPHFLHQGMCPMLLHLPLGLAASRSDC